MKNQNQEKIRCTISLEGCAGGHDPETPGYWDLHQYGIIIDILEQGSKEGNEKSVLENLNKGEFTTSLSGNFSQDGIKRLREVFNKENVIKAMEGTLTSDLASGILLSEFLNDLRNDIKDCSFDIYVDEYRREIDEDDEDFENEYPDNINDEAFSDIWGWLPKGIVFEKLKS